VYLKFCYNNFMEPGRITHDPNVMGGRACIRGTRVTVGAVLTLLADYTPEEILDRYPYLEPEDIQAALRYAAWRVEERELSL
jgi:uncharacterized protein (DUF433 family)